MLHLIQFLVPQPPIRFNKMIIPFLPPQSTNFPYVMLLKKCQIGHFQETKNQLWECHRRKVYEIGNSTNKR